MLRIKGDRGHEKRGQLASSPRQFQNGKSPEISTFKLSGGGGNRFLSKTDRLTEFHLSRKNMSIYTYFTTYSGISCACCI